MTTYLKFKNYFRFTFLLISCFTIFSCSEHASAQTASKFIGQWQGLTRGSSAYDPMFTLIIKPNGMWTDMTFGEAHAANAKYKYDAKKIEITLFSTKGSKLYSFKIEPATSTQKERMVEQLPANEAYRAIVCYRYKKS